MDKRFRAQAIAGWYLPAAVASLIVMLLGCGAFLMHVTTNAAALPLDQRAAFEAEPNWVLAASGVAFLSGLIGTVLLIARRSAAQPLLLLALAAALVWVAGMLLTPGFRDLLSTSEIAIALIVLALFWTIFWFARHSRQRGWLR
jgi:hypothetical protein